MQTNITLSELEASNQLIVDYKEIASSRLVIEPVMEELGIDMALKDFRKALSWRSSTTRACFRWLFERGPKACRRVADAMAYQLRRLCATSSMSRTSASSTCARADGALLPERPTSITLLAAVVGLLGGLLFVYFNDLFNDTFSSQEGVESELQMDVIAIIPNTRTSARPTTGARHAQRAELLPVRELQDAPYEHQLHEQGRREQGRHAHELGAAEGKTTTSCNLAIAMAQEHKKCC
jgi:capsular polysaccharide biosynthesis protein